MQRKLLPDQNIYYLVDNKKNILIDCGLFQGAKELRIRNWNSLPFNPKILNAVILTHAYIDYAKTKGQLHYALDFLKQGHDIFQIEDKS